MLPLLLFEWHWTKNGEEQKEEVQKECNFELVLRRLKEILEITIVYSMQIISIHNAFSIILQ